MTSDYFDMPDGSVYYGEIEGGLPHGFGKTTVSGSIFIGQWLYGRKSGSGVLIHNDRWAYIGTWVDDKSEDVDKVDHKEVDQAISC